MVRLEYPDYIYRKLIGVQRYLLWFYGGNYYLRVAEFPKSGGSWLCQMLSELLGRAFPRNRAVGLTPSILLSHFNQLSSGSKAIWLVRDGRDVMISCYYHFLIGHEYSNSIMIQNWRKIMPFSNYEDVKENLQSFIEVFHNHYKSGRNLSNWGSHADFFVSNKNRLQIKYENLLVKPTEQLSLMLDYLSVQCDHNLIDKTIQKFSFENNRPKKKDDAHSGSFLRKGISGDWNDYFDFHCAQKFDQLYGKQLIGLGYETNRDWIHNLK